MTRRNFEPDLSEPLGCFELTDGRWCVLEVCRSLAVRIEADDAVVTLLPLDGDIVLNADDGSNSTVTVGDVRFLLPGARRTVWGSFDQPDRETILPPLRRADTPPTLRFTAEPASVRLLVGKLTARWPAGIRRDLLPDSLSKDRSGSTGPISSLVLATVADILAKRGAEALLTRFATLTMAICIRTLPICTNLFELDATKARVLRATQLVEDDHAADWTVASLAARVGMGRSAFAASFKNATGVSPMAYVVGRRMAHAQKLLRSGNLKIAEIALRAGYDSVQTFHRCFRQHFGTAPGQIRKESRRRSGYAAMSCRIVDQADARGRALVNQPPTVPEKKTAAGAAGAGGRKQSRAKETGGLGMPARDPVAGSSE